MGLVPDFLEAGTGRTTETSKRLSGLYGHLMEHADDHSAVLHH